MADRVKYTIVTEKGDEGKEIIYAEVTKFDTLVDSLYFDSFSIALMWVFKKRKDEQSK